MVILAPAHPVYAAIEDRIERDRQAEDHTEHLRNACLTLQNHLAALWTTKSEMAMHIEAEVMDALHDAFVDGWNAARAEQKR